jgi:hypothetical protein
MVPGQVTELEDLMRGTQEVPDSRLSRTERHRLKQQKKEAERRSRDRTRFITKALTKAGIGLLAVIGLGWLGYSTTTAKRLPPTDMNNHVEELPPARILTTPIPIAVQKHILEHADGRRRPGVVINYNCVKFRCPDGMVDRLTQIARGYPEFVYLAPYPEMDVRIAVTRLGQILTLEELDEKQIRAFIGS